MKNILIGLFIAVFVIGVMYTGFSLANKTFYLFEWETSDRAMFLCYAVFAMLAGVLVPVFKKISND